MFAMFAKSCLVGGMPFKDAAARAAYMKQYEADYRQGKRRTDADKPVSERTLKARARAVKQRKRLWFLQNKEWCLDRQRERRRSAAEEERAALLDLISNPPADAGSAGEIPKPAGRGAKAARRPKNKPTTHKAA